MIMLNQLIKVIFKNVKNLMNVMVKYNSKDFIIIYKVLFLVINVMIKIKFHLLV